MTLSHRPDPAPARLASRRWFLRQCGVGLGGIALADLLGGTAAAKRDDPLAPKFKFARHGQGGTEMSELLPHLACVADDLCVVKSMVTDAFNHAPAQIFLSTGAQQFGRPSLGAWALYGLGSASRDLPGFVV